MSAHRTVVKRSGEGVVGTCSCKRRQAKPVATRQEAEDWCTSHEEQARRSQAGAEKALSPVAYLEYLRDKAADPDLSRRERDQWQVLADEQERRVKRPATPAKGQRPYDTGVETEPMF